MGSIPVRVTKKKEAHCGVLLSFCRVRARNRGSVCGLPHTHGFESAPQPSGSSLTSGKVQESSLGVFPYGSHSPTRRAEAIYARHATSKADRRVSKQKRRRRFCEACNAAREDDEPSMRRRRQPTIKAEGLSPVPTNYFLFTGIFEIALKMPNAAKNIPSTAAVSMARRTHTFGAILMRTSMIEPPPSEVPVAR